MSGGGQAGEPQALTQQEVARRLDVSRHTVMRLEREGRLGRLPGPGRPRYRAADVVALVRARQATRSPADLRAELLLRAAEITVREGAQACTVQAVAEAAGVTGGAVAHHFPHKEDLLRGLVGAFVERLDARLAQERAAGRGAADAYVVATLDGGPEPVSAALLACASHDPALLRPLEGHLRRWYGEVAAEGPEAVRRCLAADAVWLFALFGLVPVDDVDRPGLLPDRAQEPKRR